MGTASNPLEVHMGQVARSIDSRIPPQLCAVHTSEARRCLSLAMATGVDYVDLALCSYSPHSNMSLLER